MPLKLFLNVVNCLTLVPLTAVSSQNASKESYWVKVSLHKTWQWFNGSHVQELLLKASESLEMYGAL